MARLAIPVVARDVRTGEETVFESVAEACYCFDSTPMQNVLRKPDRRGIRTVDWHVFMYKHEQELLGWPEIPEHLKVEHSISLYTDNMYAVEKYDVTLSRILTTTFAVSQADVVEALGVCNWLTWGRRVGKDFINGIYKIRVATDAEKVANRDLYTAFSKSLHNRTSTRYNVTNAEGVSLQFETLVGVADYIKRPRSTVTPAMYRKYELNGFTIEKVMV